jgi:hypothetical protein
VSDGWEAALAECEARLDAAAAAPGARAGEAEIAPFTAPEVDGPLPAPLVDRARRIVERAEVLEHRLTDEQGRIRAELRRLPRLPPAVHQTSFDKRA